MALSIKTIKPLLQKLFDDAESPINGFRVQNHNSNQWFWIADKENIIGDLDAHYEVIRIEDDTIRVDIHFEDDSLGKGRFYEYIKELPEGLIWIKWQNKSSIRYNTVFSFDDDNLPKKIHDALADFDRKIAATIRFIKTNTISREKVDKFKISFNKFRTTEKYRERIEQFKIVPEFRKIIEHTLTNELLTNEHLTGLIQMFKYGVQDETFDKYFYKNMPESALRKRIYDNVYEIGEYGYTGAGLNSVDGLSVGQLAIIKRFLHDAFLIQSVKDAVELCKNYENHNIPYIKSGIYSPWLYYINPHLYPIKNTSHKAFLKWAGMSDYYPDCIYAFNQLKTAVNESELGNIDYYAHLFNENDIDNETSLPMKNNQTSLGLNTILYGPPGTGKTYHSIYHALSVIENKSVEELKEEKYEQVKERFDKLLITDTKDEHQKGRIGFVTFHQSMSYEDFIEGIKPNLFDEGEKEITYEIKDGIFKYISTIAKIGPEERKSPEFESAYTALLDFIRKQPHEKYVLNTLKYEKPFTIYINSKNNLRFHANTEKAYEGVIKEGVIKTYLETGIAPDWVSYTSAVGEFMKERFGYTGTADSFQRVTKPYVLIIDEINRGNVSQIFGELITLIEENKRQGNPEELGAILTYSREYFTVPSNLCIIGTMNTADRSVEALDTALRRRFIFKGIDPNPTLLNGKIIDGISLETLLTALNERIGYLLDADHKIGHSYFLKVNTTRDLKEVFNNAIIPLLKEYFYNDYEKIYWVLGSGFIKPDNNRPEFAFGTNPDVSKDAYKFEAIDENFNISEALKITINAKA